jgi:hypothetical protein
MITEEEKLSVSVKKMGIAEKNMILVPVRRRRSTKAEGTGCTEEDLIRNFVSN